MTVAIPNRPVFRAQEVCDLAEVQPYVLRTWEAEFPDLGVAKGGARIYRRADVERVLRIKHLLFVDGLTMSGVRRRLSEEGQAPVAEAVTDGDLAQLIDGETRQQLREVRRGLQWILGVLSGEDATSFSLQPEAAAPVRLAKSAPAARSASAARPKSVKKAGKAKK